MGHARAVPGEPRAESGCPFCESVRTGGAPRRRTVYEDEVFLAAQQTSTEDQSVLGVVLPRTRGHVPSLGALTGREAARLGGGRARP